MVAFVYAMEKEALPLLEEVTILSDKKMGKISRLLEVSLNKKKFLIVISGIGKAFAASSLSSAFALHPEIDAVINLGVSGSLNEKEAPIFSAVIGKEFVEHDLDTSAIGDPVGMVSGINVVFLPSSEKWNSLLKQSCEELKIPSAEGVISSGDVFLSSRQRKEEIRAQFGTLSLDMESAPYAQIAYCYEKPFSALRVITDIDNLKSALAGKAGTRVA